MNPLLIPELFNRVLDCLALSAPLTLEERTTLVALARTCSSFTEPALDRLWWRLESILPLVRSFADNVDEARVKTLPSPEEWFVISRYAHRIREVKLGTEQLSLHFLRCTNLILPNLKVLSWERQRRDIPTDSEIVSLSSLWPLFAPRIVTLELTLDKSTLPEFQSLLENYPSPFLNLDSINFDLRSLGVSALCFFIATQVLSQPLRAHTSWKRVGLSSVVDNALLRHLGLSCELEAVSFALDPWGENPIDETYFRPTDLPFRSTSRLYLIVWDRFDGVTDLLRPHEQAFNTFQVHLRDARVTTMEMYAFVRAVVSPSRIRSLRSLTLSQICMPFYVARTPPEEGQGLSYEMLQPLMSLVHLRELVITLELPIAIDDDEFVDLIRHWPRLEVLSLMGSSKDYAKMVSLKGLLSLLVMCPRLNKIGLSVDARQVPSGTGADVCLPAVTSITFQDSPMRDLDLVDAFLLTHLPNAYVDGIVTQFGETREVGMWRMINVRRKDFRIMTTFWRVIFVR